MQPYNLTGFQAQLIAQYENKTFNINCNINCPLEGKIELSLRPYETKNIWTIDYRFSNITIYNYQLNLISENEVKRILQGAIKVCPCAG